MEGSVGEQVREMREAQARTLEDVAEAVGISPPYLSRIENDRQLAARRTFQAIAGQLSERPDELVAERDKAELVSMGYSPEAADIAVALEGLDADERRVCAKEIAQILTPARQQEDSADPPLEDRRVADDLAARGLRGDAAVPGVP